MEIKLPIIDCDRGDGRYFAMLKLLVADEYVFFDGFERANALLKEDDLDESTYNSIIADPGDVTLRFNTKELYVLAKAIVAFYELGGVRDDEK